MSPAATEEKEHARGLRADKAHSQGGGRASGSTGADASESKPGRREQFDKKYGNKLEGGIDQIDPAKQAKGQNTQAAEKYARDKGMGTGRAGAMSGIGAGLDRGESGLGSFGRNAAGGAARGMASEQAAKRGLGQAKASGVASAAESLARGEGARAAADKGLAAAAQTKKVQNFRMILAFIRGGSAITLVGIVITILIWGLQLLLGHMMGKEAWKMSKLEMMIALPVCVILLVLLVALIVILVMLTTSFFKLIGWIFF
jgi:hypothetical protein